jgi:phospholipase C
MMLKRRQVIQAGISVAALGGVEKALALPARSDARSIMDVEHVVILMQENRAFDHYFGSLKGVRAASTILGRFLCPEADRSGSSQQRRGPRLASHRSISTPARPAPKP